MPETCYHVCGECAVAIMNNDLTSYDLDVPRVTEFIERVGLLVDAGMISKTDWSCESCDQYQGDQMVHCVETAPAPHVCTDFAWTTQDKPFTLSASVWDKNQGYYCQECGTKRKPEPWPCAEDGRAEDESARVVN